MASEHEPFGKDLPFIANPLEVREILMGRLGTLFACVQKEEIYTWGAGVEPVATMIDIEQEGALVVAGIARFGSATPTSRRVGFLQRIPQRRRGPYYTACEWPCDFDLQGWLDLPIGEMGKPVQYTHLLPEPGIFDPLTPLLDLYVLSVLNLTTFDKESTAELKEILEHLEPDSE